jgi:formylglycine-generating enzyme required for sulfatase activity
MFCCAAVACSPARNLVKPEMVPVKGGTYIVGDYRWGLNMDATPRHQVRIKPFKMMRYEVTYRQYDTLAARYGWEKPSDDGLRADRAVTYITWDEAKRFCACIGMRLPTEVEWEYAARSGGKNERVSGTADTTFITLYGSFVKDPVQTRNHTGRKRPNALGLHDMSGSVFEWIGDYYAVYDHEKKDGRKYVNLKKNPVRIIRGGSFLTYAQWPWTRTGTLHDSRQMDVGFRCVQPRGFFRRLLKPSR